MKKIFTFAAALLASVAMMADDTTIFLWQYDGSSVYGDGSTNGIFDVANDANGIVKFVTYEKKKTSADGTSAYAESVKDDDLKPSITKVCKLGNNGAHLRISPAAGNFQAGDVIYICGYKDFIVSTSSDPTSTANITTADGGAVIIAASLATGEAKGSCAVGSVVLPESFVETNEIYISRANGASAGVAAIKVVRASADHTKATVRSIAIDGENLAEFAADKLIYDVELAYGTVDIPVVTAVAGNDANIVVTQADALPGSATVACTSYDGEAKVTYTLNFTVSSSASSDATLKSLSINGTAIAKFKADSFAYAYEIAYADALPVVTAETNDANAKAVVTDVTEVPGTATVVVTAQDGTTTLTYSVAFTRAAVVKKINEVIMSNGYSAYIKEGQSVEPYVINAYYLAGQDAPTVASYKVSEGTTWSQDGNTITLTGADASTATYTLTIEAVAPLEFTTDEITFDGTETWIKSGYGFDDSKKWKFSKTDNDYSREIAGKTHLEMFLPACDSLDLLEANVSSRDIKVYINGAQFGDKVTLAKNKKLGLKVAQAAPFMLTIASAQTSGDGGIASIQLFKGGESAINNTEAAVKAVKVIREGQMFIQKNGVLYNMQGAVVK